nr:MAG TPA: dUTPase [Caudoviricetes sp.]
MNVPDPVRAHSTDAGLDLYIPEGQGRLVRHGAVHTINLGIRVAIPDGYYGQLTLRSSAGKRGLTIPNGVGIIDSGYRGDLKLAVAAISDPVLVAAEERICQLIILPQPVVDVEAAPVEDDTARGEGGFGSSGGAAAAREHTPREAGRLTIGRLMGQLQNAASRYGNDTPVAVLADDGTDYEQGGGLLIVNAVKTGCAGGWDQYRADANGAPMAVIS